MPRGPKGEKRPADVIPQMDDDAQQLAGSQSESCRALPSLGSVVE
jgi:hypothetical protein